MTTQARAREIVEAGLNACPPNPTRLTISDHLTAEVLEYCERVRAEAIEEAAKVAEHSFSRRDGEVAADIRALSDQPYDPWLPIETAPRQGRDLILILTPTNWPQVAYSNTWWRCGFSVENKPTRWMPLPPPSKETGC